MDRSVRDGLPPEAHHGPGEGPGAVESPERPQQLFDEAYAAWEAGKPGSALRACDAALAADPGWAEVHNLRGVVLDGMGYTQQAIAAYQEALRLSPDLEAARCNLLEARADLKNEAGPRGPVVIRRFSFPSEAEIARGRLEAEGIPAVVLQAEIVNMQWFYSNMVGGVKLCVDEEDAEIALAVLEGEPLPPEPEECCPRCGSGDVAYARYNLRWVNAAILLFKFPLPIKQNRWICQRCGARWADGPIN